MCLKAPSKEAEQKGERSELLRRNRKNDRKIADSKRASEDLDGPAKTNLLFVLCVKKGLIIRLKARYHHGTLMNT